MTQILVSSPMEIPNRREEDSLLTPRSTLSNPSPRCEAFVMTGEKMLRLNAKISPCYARAKQEQLPPDTAVLDTPDNHRRGPFDDLQREHRVTARRRLQNGDGVSVSRSEHVLGESQHGGISRVQIEEEIMEDDQSSVTVDAVCRGGDSALQTPTTEQLPKFQFSQSEPASPARPATIRTEESESKTLVIPVGDSSPRTEQIRESAPSPVSSASLDIPLREKPRHLNDSKEAENGAVVCGGSENGGDVVAATRLARRLFDLDGFRKSDVSSHLSRNNEFTARVAQEYVHLFNFAGLRIDAAIRKFLSRFCLLGESSERERILTYFSKRYNECNPGLFESDDEVHTLACSLLLLNSDLHGQNSRRKMSCHEFVENVSHTGYSFKSDLLKALYRSIKATSIQWAEDPSESRTTLSAPRYDSHFLEFPDPESQVEYKKGWVMRKCVVDEDGKRTPLGRRGWNLFYATLKGLVLYLHKDENGFKRGSYQTFRNAIRIHHALATRAHGYCNKRRQHVFRVRTATLGEYLFETGDPEEVDKWMEAINFVAGCFSAPPLPAPVSSKSDFHRPVLPSMAAALSMQEQIAEHQRQLTLMQEQLERLKACAPPLTAKGPVVQEYFFKERFLEEEKERYGTYVWLLRGKLATGSSGCSEDVESADSSAQSDRLSYRAAIGTWNGPEASFETVF